MTLKALVFDVDGTLAETEELHRRAFNDTFADYELPWRWSPRLYGELLARWPAARSASCITSSATRAAILDRIAPLVAEAHRAQDPALRGTDDGRAAAAAQWRRAADRRGARPSACASPSRRRRAAPTSTALLADALCRDGEDMLRRDRRRRRGRAEKAGPGRLREGARPSSASRPATASRSRIPRTASAPPARPASRSSSRRASTRPGRISPGALAVVSELGLPGRSYEHLAGAGRHDRNVTVERAATRWHADEALPLSGTSCAAERRGRRRIDDSFGRPRSHACEARLAFLRPAADRSPAPRLAGDLGASR